MSGKKSVFNFDNQSAEYYDLKLDSKQEVAVIGGGYEHCGPEYRVSRQGFEYHVIEFIESGKGMLVLNGEKYPLFAGTIFSFGPEVPHQITTDPKETLVKHYVMFMGAGLIRQVTSMNLSAMPLHAPYPFRMDQLFKNLLQMGAREGRHRNKICLLQLEQLLLYIDGTAIPQKDSESPALQTYLRARNYIEENYLDVQNLEQIAVVCHSDKSYLCRLFKRYAHETPLQMLVRLKMRYAADLILAAPDTPIKQIASEVDYSDPYYFSRVFKSVFGISPGNYCKIFRGGNRMDPEV